MCIRDRYYYSSTSRSQPCYVWTIIRCNSELLFPYFFFISNTHAASELLSWSMELLAFGSRQFAPRIVDLSVRFIRISFAASSCERWRKPPAERKCIPLVCTNDIPGMYCKRSSANAASCLCAVLYGTRHRSQQQYGTFPFSIVLYLAVSVLLLLVLLLVTWVGNTGIDYPVHKLIEKTNHIGLVGLGWD